MKKLIIGNWKMHPASIGEAQKLVQELNRIRSPKEVEIVVCPSFIHLPLIRTKFFLGAQDACWGKVGALTGGVSPEMLKRIGVRYVILGHSERRLNLGESDELVARKIKSVLAEGLTPILCVGESIRIRRRGFDAGLNFVMKQLRACLGSLGAKEKQRVVVAYEPVWAISTMPGAKADKPEEAVRMIRAIRKVTNSRVIYGGSVNSSNASAFLNQPEIQGALVGGASLKPADFKKIIYSVARK